MREAPKPEDDIFSRPRIVRALRLHRAKHPDWMTNRELKDGLGCDKKTLILTRREMDDAGLLEVEEGHEGKVPYVRTRLTPEGLRVADLILSADAEVAKARKRRDREKAR